jgi:hypothetical protein
LVTACRARSVGTKPQVVRSRVRRTAVRSKTAPPVPERLSLIPDRHFGTWKAATEREAVAEVPNAVPFGTFEDLGHQPSRREPCNSRAS